MKPIFLFHQVAHVPVDADPLGLVTSPEKFMREMADLYHAGFKCLSLDEWVAGRGKETLFPQKRFVITFDDGYRDIYTTVWPILAQYGFFATVFLVGNYISDNKSKQVYASEVPFLSWNEVGELAQAGFTFGSHTLTHPRLTALNDEQAQWEITGSKALIEEKTGLSVNLFSYPYGNSDARIQRMVAENGYIAACGVDRGRWGSYNLWRAQCKRSDNSLSFGWKAQNGHSLVYWLREQTALGLILRRLMRVVKKGRYLSETQPRKEVKVKGQVPF